MKILHEDGDEVYFEGEKCVVRGATKKLNGIDGLHLSKPNGDIAFVPSAHVMSFDKWLLDECIKLLDAHEQWEAGLTTDDDNELLETLSTSSYDQLLRLQEKRNDIARAIALHNKGKN